MVLNGLPCFFEKYLSYCSKTQNLSKYLGKNEPLAHLEFTVVCRDYQVYKSHLMLIALRTFKFRSTIIQEKKTEDYTLIFCALTQAEDKTAYQNPARFTLLMRVLALLLLIFLFYSCYI